ncbi:hypothetical protein [Kibdelosporangium banguiense]|nr:hypothetical protein [Kibdelosporangium banguiense]
MIAWWDLTHSKQTIDTLREHLREDGVKPWADVVGLRLKVWIADPAGNRWGAIMLWETVPDPWEMPPNKAAKLIGYPPTERIRFDVEATIEGVFTEPGLSGIGLALEAP